MWLTAKVLSATQVELKHWALSRQMGPTFAGALDSELGELIFRVSKTDDRVEFFLAAETIPGLPSFLDSDDIGRHRKLILVAYDESGQPLMQKRYWPLLQYSCLRSIVRAQLCF